MIAQIPKPHSKTRCCRCGYDTLKARESVNLVDGLCPFCREFLHEEVRHGLRQNATNRRAPMNKLTDFTIRYENRETGEEYTETVKGYRVKIPGFVSGFDWFVYKHDVQRAWIVSDAGSGMRIASEWGTPEAAIATAASRLKRVGRKKVLATVRERDKGLNPRPGNGWANGCETVWVTKTKINTQEQEQDQDPEGRR